MKAFRKISSILKYLFFLFLGLSPVFVLAAPEGGIIVNGSGSISQDTNITNINQTSQNLIVNWNQFNIQPNEIVNFYQPNQSSIALNRVLGLNGTEILGQLNANGQIFILNPNGVLFGANSQVDVGGIVASTLSLSNENFLSNKFIFEGSSGSILNKGNIQSANNGYVALIGNYTSNEGTISTKFGSTALVSGNKVTLDFSGDGLLNVSVDEYALNALVENKGLIKADGGVALMTSYAKDALLNTVINNEGIVQARTVENKNGVIKLLGAMDSGTVKVAGLLDASALSEKGNGGFIETSGRSVKIDPNTKVTTYSLNGEFGSWLIDPNNYLISSSGGDITGTLLSSNLNSSSITILSAAGSASGDGDILVSDAISWTSNTTLTLSAYRNIEVNSNITATGNTARIIFTPSTGTSGNLNINNDAKVTLSGTNPSLTIAGEAYQIINNLNALQAMKDNLTGFFALGSDIDASSTSDNGFIPIGLVPRPVRDGYAAFMFNGKFNGLGHSIDDLTVSGTLAEGGLFGSLFNQVSISNLILNRANIFSGTYANGGLAISTAGGTINRVRIISSNITGVGGTGGLVGHHGGGIISNSSIDSLSSVDGGGGDQTGGLVGSNYGTISNSTSAASVRARAAGGLVGLNGDTGVIINSSTSGTVTAVADVNNANTISESIGAIIGINTGGYFSNISTTGSVINSSNNSIGTLRIDMLLSNQNLKNSSDSFTLPTDLSKTLSPNQKYQVALQLKKEEGLKIEPTLEAKYEQALKEKTEEILKTKNEELALAKQSLEKKYEKALKEKTEEILKTKNEELALAKQSLEATYEKDLKEYQVEVLKIEQILEVKFEKAQKEYISEALKIKNEDALKIEPTLEAKYEQALKEKNEEILKAKNEELSLAKQSLEKKYEQILVENSIKVEGLPLKIQDQGLRIPDNVFEIQPQVIF